MMRLLAFIIASGLGLHYAQSQNLLPNGQFEDYFECPGVNTNVITGCINDWGTPGVGSPDYYHFCTPNDWVLPTHNVFGNQTPLSGNAFVGIYCFTPQEPEGREYIQVKLNEPIYAGVRYKVSFNVSLADMSRYAISSLGAHFSHQPLTQSTYWVIDVEPQIQNAAGNIIADTSGWVLVTDTFVSRGGGGEEWLTIGNFNYAAESDTFAFQPPNPDMGNFFHSYYYIDDVSVVALDSVPSSIEEHFGSAQGTVKFWPNPATDVLNISGNGQKTDLRLFDVSGREVLRQSSQSGKEGLGEVDISALPTGIYILELTNTEGRRATERIIKIGWP